MHSWEGGLAGSGITTEMHICPSVPSASASPFALPRLEPQKRTQGLAAQNQGLQRGGVVYSTLMACQT